MLIKSIKHDIMATYRDFSGIYVALLVAALIGPFIFQIGNEIISSIAVLSLMGISVATLVITFLTIIRLYNRRLFSNEGYLTLTLPVKTHITIISKVITGMIWSIVTALVFIAAAAIFYGIYNFLYAVFKMADIGQLLRVINELLALIFQWEVIKVFLVQLPLSLISMIKDLTLLVFIMTFVNTSFIKKGKLPIGVAAYMVIGSIISEVFRTIMLLVDGSPIVFNNPEAMIVLGEWSADFTINPLAYGVEVILYAAIIFGLGYASWWLLENKLEIE